MIYISKVVIDKKGVSGVSHLRETLIAVGNLNETSSKDKFQQ